MTVEPYIPQIPLGQWNGGQVNEWVTCVRADNPGHMTLDGTNTWIISRPGSSRAVIVDPGPADDEHFAEVAAALTGLGVDPTAGVEAILITHHHADHTAGIDLFAGHTSAPVYAFTAEHCRKVEEVSFTDGSTELELRLAELDLVVTAAPGHTRDSIAIVVPEAEMILTGDTILGRGTTVVAYPDGNLAQYLDSVQRIRNMVLTHDLKQVLPGHGPTIEEPLTAIDFYLDHRQARLNQVEACLTELGQQPRVDDELAREVVERVYADVPQHLWPPATRSVLAQLEYLATTPD